MEKQLSQHAKDIAQSLATKHFDFTMRFDKQLVKAKYDVLAPLMKKDAEISQQVSEMNKQQVEALNVLLENTLNKQEKKSFPKTFLWNLFFCILSAILGFVLGKYL